MSWQASDWMDSLPYDVAKPLATRVLLKLANVAAQDGTRAFRNAWEMADELGVDRRSIQRALRELEASDLIRTGDQRAVGHLNANRRPTVYNLNLGYHRMYAQPEIPLPDDGEDTPAEGDEQPDEPGATGLSTDEPGATFGATRSVPLGTNGTTYQDLNNKALEPYRALAPESEAQSAPSGPVAVAPAVASGQEIDAVGGSLLDAGASVRYSAAVDGHRIAGTSTAVAEFDMKASLRRAVEPAPPEPNPTPCPAHPFMPCMPNPQTGICPDCRTNTRTGEIS